MLKIVLILGVLTTLNANTVDAQIVSIIKKYKKFKECVKHEQYRGECNRCNLVRTCMDRRKFQLRNGGYSFLSDSNR